MKVSAPEHQNKNTLSTMLLELQFSMKLSQLETVLSCYQELFAFFLQYGFLLKNREIASQGGDFTLKEDELTTPDPARDGTNWVVYCAANPVGRWDPSGLESEVLNKIGEFFSNLVEDIKSIFSGNSNTSSGSNSQNLSGNSSTQTARQKVVVFAQVNLYDNANNFFYNLLVDWKCKKIKRAAKKAGYDFEFRPGKAGDGSAADFNLAQQDSSIARIIVIGHGYTDGRIADETDIDGKDPSKLFTINKNCVVPVIDMVGCYANKNYNYRHNQTNIYGNSITVNTYNPHNDEIWWNQTNKVLNEIIPNSIQSGNPNSGGEPTVEKDWFTYWLRGLFL